jgi:hypothetical protein
MLRKIKDAARGAEPGLIMSNPLGDPPALPVRQLKFDKYWNMASLDL